MNNLDNRIANADQLLTQDVEKFCNSITDLYSLQIEDDELFAKKITYKINLAHPFFMRFERLKNEEDYQPIISIIRSLVLAEVIAPSQGTKNAGNVRMNFNHFLRNI